MAALSNAIWRGFMEYSSLSNTGFCLVACRRSVGKIRHASRTNNVTYRFLCKLATLGTACRTERRQHEEGDLNRALADLAAEVYQLPAARFSEHARYRAEAMTIRDNQAELGTVSEADWQNIHDLLRRSWTSLWQTVNES